MKEKESGVFEQLIGKKVIPKVQAGAGTTEHWNLHVLPAEGCLVTTRDQQGKISRD